jgi:uncharacterized membrane protein (UPF0127 family)
MSSSAHFLTALVAGPASAYQIRIERSGEVLARFLDGAFDSASRNKGLLGRTGMATDQAMVIAPCTAVHTFWMKFTIDLVYAARDGRVLKIRRRVAPWRMSAAIGGFAVIELAAGRADLVSLQKGDRLVVEKV